MLISKQVTMLRPHRCGRRVKSSRKARTSHLAVVVCITVCRAIGSECLNAIISGTLKYLLEKNIWNVMLFIFSFKHIYGKYIRLKLPCLKTDVFDRKSFLPIAYNLKYMITWFSKWRLGKCETGDRLETMRNFAFFALWYFSFKCTFNVKKEHFYLF